MTARDVVQALGELRDRIRAAGGDPDALTIVAVTKGFGPDVVGDATKAGLVDLGENYAKEMLAKADAAGGAPVRWHYIGRLQRNKVRAVAHLVHLWQSIDRLSLAEEVARRAPGAAVLVQVNVTGEAHKGGCLPALAPGIVDGAVDLGLDVQGLMTVGPTGGGPPAARTAFARLARLADRLGLRERSMGMTADLEAAVAEGATIVRVGSALFGPRPPLGTDHMGN